jgi:hypothetical protein
MRNLAQTLARIGGGEIMYGPSDGVWLSIAVFALIGILASVAGIIYGVWWLYTHISFGG